MINIAFLLVQSPLYLVWWNRMLHHNFYLSILKNMDYYLLHCSKDKPLLPTL